MRRVALLTALTVAGLGLADSARAQHGAGGSHYGAVRLNAGPLCQKCVAQMEKRVTADPRDVALAQQRQGALLAMGHDGSHSDCVTCDQGISGLAYADSAPGYATVGYGQAAEPAPIGVMRTAHVNGALPPSAYHGAAPSAQPTAGPVIPPPMSHSMSYPGVHKRRLVGNVLGLPRLGGLGEAREARRREQHAALRYDDSAQGPASLPSSAVYGR